MAKVTNILAGDGFMGELSSIASTTTKEEKKKLRDQFYKDLIDNAVAIPVGLAEGAVGLPGDIEGLARGAYRAYNAEDGKRLEAFGSAFADTTLPSTQQIQDFTNEYLLDNEFGEMVRRGKYGRLTGEILAPASLVTAPARAGAKVASKALTNTALKGANALSDSKFYQTLSNPLNIDAQPNIFKKSDIGFTKYALDQGLSGDDLWKTFGITKGDNLGYPGNYISEISDEFAKLKVPGNELKGTKKLEDILEHDELFKAFPQLKDTRVSIETGGFKGATDFMPSIKPESPKIILNPGRHADDNDILSTLMHELEHITSYSEGGKPGANIMDIMQKNPTLSPEDALKRYLADSGEVGAGTVQRRLGLNKAERMANRPDLQGRYGIDIDPKDIVQGDSIPAFGERRGQLSIEDFGDLGIKPDARKYSDAQNFYDYFNADKVPEANQMGYFEPYFGAPKDDPLNYLLTKSSRGDDIGQLVPKDTPIQPATNTFYDDIRMNDKFPEPTRDSFEFTHGSGDSKGGPVSVIKDINVPYKPLTKGGGFKGQIGGNQYDPLLGHADPLEFFNAPKKDKVEKAVEYLQPKTKQTPTTGITPDRAEKLTTGKITPDALPNHTVDKAWATSTERPYDTTQFIRDTQVPDGDLFARLARDNSREYTGMFDVMPYSDNIHTKPRFENVGNPEYMTPHTGKFVQEIKTPNGNYAKFKLSSVRTSNAKSLQAQVDSAIDIANNNTKYATPEDKLDAFVEAMGRIEGLNTKYVSRGKPMKVKDDAMNYLWQIHDDLQKEAMASRYNLMPQRTEQGQIMFNDAPKTNKGTGEVDMDEFMQNLAEGNRGIL